MILNLWAAVVWPQSPGLSGAMIAWVSSSLRLYFLLWLEDSLTALPNSLRCALIHPTFFSSLSPLPGIRPAPSWSDGSFCLPCTLAFSPFSCTDAVLKKSLAKLISFWLLLPKGRRITWSICASFGRWSELTTIALWRSRWLEVVTNRCRGAGRFFLSQMSLLSPGGCLALLPNVSPDD